MTPGDWYLAVYNMDVVPVSYIVRATELLPPPIVRLTNASPFTNIVLAPNGDLFVGTSGQDVYVIPHADGAGRAGTPRVFAHFDDSPAAGKYDLLTVLLHETGHLLGFTRLVARRRAEPLYPSPLYPS